MRFVRDLLGKPMQFSFGNPRQCFKNRSPVLLYCPFFMAMEITSKNPTSGTGKSDDKEKRGVHYDPDVARLNDVVVDKKMREKKRGVHLDLGEDVARLNDFEE